MIVVWGAHNRHSHTVQDMHTYGIANITTRRLTRDCCMRGTQWSFTHCPDYVHCHGITKITRRLACDCCMRGLTLYIHTLSRLCIPSWDNKDHKKISMWLFYEGSHCTFTHCRDYVHRHGITTITMIILTYDCCIRGSHRTLTHCPDYSHRHGITTITIILTCDCCIRGSQ